MNRGTVYRKLMWLRVMERAEVRKVGFASWRLNHERLSFKLFEHWPDIPTPDGGFVKQTATFGWVESEFARLRAPWS